jgi:putative restriction endonuclease
MDYQLRTAAFIWLGEQVIIHGDILPRTLLEQGFEFSGRRITLMGPQGIWKPKFMQIPLSITTVPGSSYPDGISGEGILIYSYRSEGGPNHPNNAGLRQAMQSGTPLIYFLGIDKGKYLAEWPVFIDEDRPELSSFIVSFDEKDSILNRVNGLDSPVMVSEQSVAYRRNYITTQVTARLHQRAFRGRVLLAYHEQCSFCRLRHRQLLDAAHIIPDKEKGGEPVIPNGLSLCKIHHAAYDNNLIGVNPDYKIIVREDILKEFDGPMLRHGIQQMHQQKIILPGKRAHWPDCERLAVRFNKFKEVS